MLPCHTSGCMPAGPYFRAATMACAPFTWVSPQACPNCCKPKCSCRWRGSGKFLTLLLILYQKLALSVLVALKPLAPL